jgi:starch-binding outer membrane protein, SusD/RagB family
MKKYIKLISINAALILVLTVVSCKKDFLELDPAQSVSNEQAFLTLDDYKSSVTAIYNGLSSANYYGRYFVLTPDVMADDVKQNAQANRAKEYAEFVAVPTHFIAEDMWRTIYSAINAANAVINANVEVPSTVQAQKDHMVGEALALRGQMYFDLVRLYAQHYKFTADASHPGVPIVLSFDITNEPTRSTVKQVYDQVISDMTAAISKMSETSRNNRTSLLTKTAVKALLARVYLYKEDYDNAITMATEVINSNKYSLVSNSNYMNAWSANYSSESIFEIANTPTDNRGSDALGGMYLGTGYGDYLPSNDLVSLIPANDVRRGWFQVDPTLTGNYAPFRLVKYPSTTGLNNTKVMRLSEVYLIRAEAYARKSNPNTTGAQNDLNTIRQRAQPTAAPVTATGTALINEIMLERRKELAFEGQRLWDLMRQKKSIVRTDCTAAICTITYPSPLVILPIPDVEMRANPNMVQNPGY